VRGGSRSHPPAREGQERADVGERDRRSLGCRGKTRRKTCAWVEKMGVVGSAGRNQGRSKRGRIRTLWKAEGRGAIEGSFGGKRRLRR